MDSRRKTEATMPPYCAITKPQNSRIFGRLSRPCPKMASLASMPHKKHCLFLRWTKVNPWIKRRSSTKLRREKRQKPLGKLFGLTRFEAAVRKFAISLLKITSVLLFCTFCGGCNSIRASIWKEAQIFCKICGSDDLWAFMLTVEALDPQTEVPPDLLVCLQHAPQSKVQPRIVNEY